MFCLCGYSTFVVFTSLFSKIFLSEKTSDFFLHFLMYLNSYNLLLQSNKIYQLALWPSDQFIDLEGDVRSQMLYDILNLYVTLVWITVSKAVVNFRPINILVDLENRGGCITKF